LVVQITTLVGSYMIWAGSCEEIPGAELPTDTSAPPSAQPTSALVHSSENNLLAGLRLDDTNRDADPRVLAAVKRGRVAKDWACAMPFAKRSTAVVGTSLFRSNDSYVSLSMAQQLAQRWKKQIFLSLDMPPKFEQGSRLIVEMEKRLVQSIRRLETPPTMTVSAQWLGGASVQ